MAKHRRPTRTPEPAEDINVRFKQLTDLLVASQLPHDLPLAMSLMISGVLGLRAHGAPWELMPDLLQEIIVKCRQGDVKITEA